MGCEPTVAWRKGQPYGDHDGVRTHSRWELRSPAFPRAHLEEQLASLLALLEESAEQIRAVGAQFEAGICCAAKYWVSFNPTIHLSSSSISRASSLGLSIDFDLCFFSRDEGESAA